METPALPRRLALTAGCNQLINWGSPLHAGNLCSCHYSRPKLVVPEIYLGLTLAMLVMAIVSPFVAPLLARFGGQRVVMSGTLLIAVSCLSMAFTPTLSGWYGARLLTGIGMRLSLYDALSPLL